MTAQPEDRPPRFAYRDDGSSTTLSFRTPPPSAAAPVAKPQNLAMGLCVSRRSRFDLPVAADSAERARKVVGTVLHLVLGSGEHAARTTMRVQTCLAELVQASLARTGDKYLLCEVWLDQDHVFIAVEYGSPLPAPSTLVGLHAVKAIADEYGSHPSGATNQMWAAIRRAQKAA